MAKLGKKVYMSDNPIVSVVVVTKNEEKHIFDCLESLVAQDFPKDKYELVVVDAASTDRTQEIVRNYPAKLIVDGYGTLAHQRNVGIENSTGDYIAFTDADCIADTSWLKALVAAIRSSPSDIVGVSGPNLVLDSDPLFSRIVGYMQETLLGSGASPQSYRMAKTKIDTISAPNCNAIYRRKVVAQERYDNNFGVGEDGELNYRLRRKGYKFAFTPNAIVWHHRVNTFKKLVNKMFSYGKAMAKMTRKHKSVVRWYAFLPPLAIPALLLAYPLTQLFPWLTYAYVFACFTYLLWLIISTAQVYQKCKSIKSLLTLVLLPTQHFSYGFGFFSGLLH